MSTSATSMQKIANDILVDLALQGGGAHGAFTWGVLDRLLEEQRLGIDGISGTSAGAMNAAVLADGYTDGGAEGARRALETFWAGVAHSARFSPFQRGPLDRLLGRWTLDQSPMFITMDLIPSTPGESAQLAFAGMTTAAAGAPPAAGVPSAKSTDDDEDGSAPSVKDGADDPISAAEDDAEPVPMSLDRDASDRSFDRQLAHLGLLDDAAPLFREGASVPGVGVLFGRYRQARRAPSFAPQAAP